MTDANFDRIRKQRRALLGGVAACLAGGIPACQRSRELGPECEDASKLGEGDQRMRATLEYVDVAPQGRPLCIDCLQYVAPPQPETCGTCKLVRGPIHPKGTCKVFVKKV